MQVEGQHIHTQDALWWLMSLSSLVFVVQHDDCFRRRPFAGWEGGVKSKRPSWRSGKHLAWCPWRMTPALYKFLCLQLNADTCKQQSEKLGGWSKYCNNALFRVLPGFGSYCEWHVQTQRSKLHQGKFCSRISLETSTKRHASSSRPGRWSGTNDACSCSCEWGLSLLWNFRLLLL